MQGKVGDCKKKKRLAVAKHLLVVGMSGLEPPTPTLSGWCSNRLSYIPLFVCPYEECDIKEIKEIFYEHHIRSLVVEIVGLEPTTFCVQGRRSSQLSYTPKTSISYQTLNDLSMRNSKFFQYFL